MKTVKKAAALATAAELARQWVRSNPEKASQYIDKAVNVLDQRTQGKYRTKLHGASSAAKKAVAREAGITPSEASSTTVKGQTAAPPPPSR